MAFVAKITPSLMAPIRSPAPKAMGMLSIFAMTAMARSRYGNESCTSASRMIRASAHEPA